MGGAEPGRRGKGASLGSVLCSSRVIELWKELRRVLSDISRAGGKFGVFAPLQWALSYIIFLTLVAYKAICSVVHRRLVHMVEEKQLVV